MTELADRRSPDFRSTTFGSSKVSMLITRIDEPCRKCRKAAIRTSSDQLIADPALAPAP